MLWISFCGDLGNVSFSENNNVSKVDLDRMAAYIVEDDICSTIFDFSGDMNNGWTVSTQDNPIIVTHKLDCKQFLVGDEGSKVNKDVAKFEEKCVLPISHELDADLKCFNSIVSAVDLDDSKNKRSVWSHFCC